MTGDGGGPRLFDAIFALLIVAGVAKFTHSALQGDYGVFASIAVAAEEDAARGELAALRAERARLEVVVTGLGDDGLDIDLVDETARDTLGLVGEADLVQR